MASVYSGTEQGSFISNGQTQYINLRESVDWMCVQNLTVLAANQTTAVAAEFKWQLQMDPNSQVAYFKSNAANAANLSQYTTAGGFQLFDNTVNTLGASQAITSISTATPPLVTVTSTTTGLSNGSIVRIFNTTSGQQLGGLDFTINDLTANTSFSLVYMNAIAAATTGSYRLVPYNPYFYPPTRVISRITPGPSANVALPASSTVVTFTVTHNFTIGQRVRFVVPTVTALAYGMPQLNLVEATIIGVGQADSVAPRSISSVALQYNTITVNFDTTAFGTFAWPLTADPVHTPAQVVPVGEKTAQAIAGGSIGVVTSTGASTATYAVTTVGTQDILGDSEVNIGQIGIALQGGLGFPGGSSGDRIVWIAGKSFSGGA
jgi:hypothetical protein